MRGLHILKHPDANQFAPPVAPPHWLLFLVDEVFSELSEAELKTFNAIFEPIMLKGPDVREVRGKLAVQRLRLNLKRLERVTEPASTKGRTALQDVIFWHEDNEPLERIDVLKLDIRKALAVVQTPAMKFALRSAMASVASYDQDEYAESAASAMWASVTAMWVGMGRAGYPPGSNEAEKAAEMAIVAHYRWEASALLKLLMEARCMITEEVQDV